MSNYVILRHLLTSPPQWNSGCGNCRCFTQATGGNWLTKLLTAFGMSGKLASLSLDAMEPFICPLLQTFLELSWCQQSVTSKRDIYRWRFTSAWKNHGKTPVSCHDSGRDHSCPSPWKYLSMPVTLQWLNDTSKISKDQQGFVMFLLMEDTRVLDFY